MAPEVEPNKVNRIQTDPAENKHDLNAVFRMFDRHYGAHDNRNIKRQQFLNTKRDNKTSLNLKAEFCEYGDPRAGIIGDMIIYCMNDRKCADKENSTRIKVK